MRHGCTLDTRRDTFSLTDWIFGILCNRHSATLEKRFNFVTNAADDRTLIFFKLSIQRAVFFIRTKRSHREQFDERMPLSCSNNKFPAGNTAPVMDIVYGKYSENEFSLADSLGTRTCARAFYIYIYIAKTLHKICAAGKIPGTRDIFPCSVSIKFPIWNYSDEKARSRARSAKCAEYVNRKRYA